MSPRPLLGRSGCVYLIPASKSCQERFWASRSVPILFWRRRPPRPLLGRSGYAYLILASKSCQDRFRAGRAVYISFRRRRSPRPLWGRLGCIFLISAAKATQTTFEPVGQKQKSKKSYGAFWDSNPYLFERSALYHIDYSDL
jgi:hypothetical protein